MRRVEKQENEKNQNNAQSNMVTTKTQVQERWNKS